MVGLHAVRRSRAPSRDRRSGSVVEAWNGLIGLAA
jgi:hypothetical protein